MEDFVINEQRAALRRILAAVVAAKAVQAGYNLAVVSPAEYEHLRDCQFAAVRCVTEDDIARLTVLVMAEQQGPGR